MLPEKSKLYRASRLTNLVNTGMLLNTDKKQDLSK